MSIKNTSPKMIEKVNETVAYIQNKTSILPDYGVILGTGLGALVNEIEISCEINYEDIPNFPVSTVEFHKGKLIFGQLGGHSVVTMQGRFHYYEGYDLKQVTFPVRVMKMLGIKKLFISNAAGALNPKYGISDLMIISDHINLQYENPLTGPNVDEQGARFPDMSEPYDLKMVNKGMRIAKEIGVTAHEGVYVGVPGPNLETKAEYKYLRMIGGDAVGMSTIPENIVARHMDLPVFAVSVLTDLCYPGHIKKVVIDEIIAAAMKAEPGMTEIIRRMIESE